MIPVKTIVRSVLPPEEAIVSVLEAPVPEAEEAEGEAVAAVGEAEAAEVPEVMEEEGTAVAESYFNGESFRSGKEETVLCD